MCRYSIIGKISSIGIEVYKSDDDWTGLRRYIKINSVSRAITEDDNDYAYAEDTGGGVKKGRYIDITNKEIIVKNMELFNFVTNRQHEKYQFNIMYSSAGENDDTTEQLHLIKAEICNE